MSYTRLRYHIVSATRNRRRLIRKEVRSMLYGVIETRARELGGAVLRCGGIEDHVHILAAIPPHTSVAAFVQATKSTSSRVLNQSQLLEERFAWQSGYGAFTVSPARMTPIIQYIERQEHHHQEGSLIATLEQTT